MKDNIKWRGGQVTRVEALTDAVFGFAITLLFVSFEVPATFDALLLQLRGFVAFAACFALLILVWVYHYKLFTRFDMDDGLTIFLNSLLLFVVLFYVYPLKFVFTAWFGSSYSGIFSSMEQVRTMMTIYALGFIAVFLVFALLYQHAYRRRDALRLSADDVFFAVDHVAECLMMALIGVLSIVIAQTAPLRWCAPLAGFSYMLIGPAQWVRAAWMRKKQPEIMSWTAS